jgi:glutathione S-transferase
MLSVQYLVETYDTGLKISFPRDSPEYYHAKQFLEYLTMFRTQAQNLVSFQQFAPHHIYGPTVKVFKDELYVLLQNLEETLRKNEHNYYEKKKHRHVAPFSPDEGIWLVGQKLSYMDLVFCPWVKLVMDASQHMLVPGVYCQHWMDRVFAREEVRDTLTKYM